MSNKENKSSKWAKEEKEFKGSELLAEIKPLIDDYFLGDFELRDGMIVCKFLNGQKFNISISEVQQ